MLLHGLCDTLQANGSQSLLRQLWLLLGTRHEATRAHQSQIDAISLSLFLSLAHFEYFWPKINKLQYRTGLSLSLSVYLSLLLCCLQFALSVSIHRSLATQHGRGDATAATLLCRRAQCARDHLPVLQDAGQDQAGALLAALLHQAASLRRLWRVSGRLSTTPTLRSACKRQ